MLVLLFIDWTQTMTIASNPEIWFELNPILGKHPSPTFVTRYFIAVAMLAVVFLVIKHRFIIPTFIMMTMIQAFFVVRNILIGI